MVEIYGLPQGKMTLYYCDEFLSIGILELNPNQELEKHNRPIDEELFQIQGTSVMKLFGEDKEVILNEDGKLTISANQPHIHSNHSDEKSITLWKFKGDIKQTIEEIRKNYNRIL